MNQQAFGNSLFVFEWGENVSEFQIVEECVKGRHEYHMVKSCICKKCQGTNNY